MCISALDLTFVQSGILGTLTITRLDDLYYCSIRNGFMLFLSFFPVFDSSTLFFQGFSCLVEVCSRR